MPQLLASLVLGALLPLAFAPFEHWWLAPLLIAVHLPLWRSAPPRTAFWRGFAFGGGAFLTGTYWLYHSVVVIGQVPIALAMLLVLGMVAIMAVYFGLNCWLLRRWLATSPAILLPLLPFLWVWTEWLRGWVLSGFPWLTLGSALPETPLSGWLPLGGVYLGSFVLVAAAVALYGLILPGRVRQVAVATLAVLAAASAGVYDRQWTVETDETLSVRIGQLGQDQRLKWRQEEFQATLQWYARFVVDSEPVDLLLMPEVAIPALAQNVRAYLAQLGQVAAPRQQTVVLGILNQPENQEPANAMLALAGGQQQWYEKRHLVPFGEFFPVPGFIRDWMRLRGLPYANIRAGDAAPSPIRVGDQLAAASICYEDAYAAEQRVFFPDASFIINISNDAWFGDTIAPHQHLQIARARSLESQRWQARSTNTGISALIDSRGAVRAQAPAFEPATLQGTLTMRAGHTPFTRVGNLPLLVISLLVLVGTAIAQQRRQTGLTSAK